MFSLVNPKELPVENVQTSLWNNLHPEQVIGVPAIIKEIDCLTATVEELLQVRANFSSSITLENTRFSGFGGWFDVHFRGSRANPARQEIELTTAPSQDNGTHWGQQVFLVHPPLRVQEGDKMAVSISMNRSKENHRLMEVELTCEMKQSSGTQLRPFTKKFFIE
ncbi:arginine N-methyltransferase PRMT10 [Thalictrum thalictroides]|uniref:Arginine N-methyltransferase PRMT10 n=1 Tax=Thalictrum thalictroides TaxID=46969 RepID=A0A7J6US04_THATH|nr:arginine N-methyltransferase PRMT10 [Thalictrum thalictroides]